MEVRTRTAQPTQRLQHGPKQGARGIREAPKDEATRLLADAAVDVTGTAVVAGGGGRGGYGRNGQGPTIVKRGIHYHKY